VLNVPDACAVCPGFSAQRMTSSLPCAAVTHLVEKRCGTTGWLPESKPIVGFRFACGWDFLALLIVMALGLGLTALRNEQGDDDRHDRRDE
jgi:hypothetical protein